MGPDQKKMADNAKARSQIYALLTTIFRAEPTEALLRELKGPQFSEVFRNLGREFHENPTAEIQEELAIEFTRLFLGPAQHLSAHESVFAELDGNSGGHWGRKTVEVKKFIESTGIEYESDFTGLPDHVSVELEFMQKLAEWEVDKWTEEDTENARYCLNVQKKFIEEHLLNWVPKFCGEVIDKADNPFYQEVAKVTKDFLEFDHKSINESLSLSCIQSETMRPI